MTLFLKRSSFSMASSTFQLCLSIHVSSSFQTYHFLTFLYVTFFYHTIAIEQDFQTGVLPLHFERFPLLNSLVLEYSRYTRFERHEFIHGPLYINLALHHCLQSKQNVERKGRLLTMQPLTEEQNWVALREGNDIQMCNSEELRHVQYHATFIFLMTLK